PPRPPMAEMSTASTRNWVRTSPLVAPNARRRPISVRRSSTAITIMLAIPTPPTRRATAPSPRSRAVSAQLVVARAASASDGRVEEAAVVHAGAEGRQQLGLGGHHRDAARLTLWDLVRAPHRGRHRAGGGRRLHRPDAADHGGRLDGQFRGVAEECAARLHL